MTTLPHVLYFVALELAVGGFLTLLFVDWRDRLPAGFRAFTAGCLLFGTGVALWLFNSMPLAEPAVTTDRGLIQSALWLSVIAMALYTVLAAAPAVLRNGFGWVSFGAVSLATILSAVEFAAAGSISPLATVATLTGAAASGAVLTGMLLGHWYLVTPSLPVRPLLRIVAFLFVAQVIQAIALPAVLVASGTLGVVLEGATGVLFWLRVIVGIVFPIILTALTWQCARIRSLQSATGLLYIAVALVVSGEIAAKSLFFLTRVPL